MLSYLVDMGWVGQYLRVGGIVDILPAAPFLVPGAWDVAVVVNGFYGEGFEPDHEPHWRDSC